MFFVSEEFLRKYKEDEEPRSTLGEVTKPGESLFPDSKPRKSVDAARARSEKDEGAH